MDFDWREGDTRVGKADVQRSKGKMCSEAHCDLCTDLVFVEVGVEVRTRRLGVCRLGNL